MINPDVVYRLDEKKRAGSESVVHGVAVSLKEFIKEADRWNIEHHEEKNIRQKLRGHPRCDSRKKQYFNIIGSEKKKIDRRDKASVRCLTCICMPRDEVPDGFFELMDAESK